MPTLAIPSRHAVAEVSSALSAQMPGNAANAGSEKALRFPSIQSSESHAKHITYRIVRQTYTWVSHPWFPNAGSWVSFNRELQRDSLRPDRLHLPLNLQRLPRPPLALQIIKIPQLQPEFGIRLEIPRQPQSRLRRDLPPVAEKRTRFIVPLHGQSLLTITGC